MADQKQPLSESELEAQINVLFDTTKLVIDPNHINDSPLMVMIHSSSKGNTFHLDRPRPGVPITIEAEKTSVTTDEDPTWQDFIDYHLDAGDE